MLSCLSGILVDQQEDMQLILSSRTISWSAPVLQVAGGESTISTSCYSCSKTPGEASDSRYFNTHTDFAHDSERRSCQIHQSEIPQTLPIPQIIWMRVVCIGVPLTAAFKDLPQHWAKITGLVLKSSDIYQRMRTFPTTSYFCKGKTKHG